MAAKSTPPLLKRRWFVLTLLAMGLLITGSILFMTFRKHTDLSHADDLLREAEVQKSAENWPEAFAAASQAYQLKPDDPQTMRALLDLFIEDKTEIKQTRFFWDKLETSGHATPQDRLKIGTAFLAKDLPGEARRLLESTPAQEKSHWKIMVLESRILAHEGRRDESQALARKAYLTNPADPECQLGLATLDLSTAFAEVRRQASDKLWKLARETQGEVQLKAIELLTQDQGLTPNGSSNLVEILNKNHTALDRYRYGVLGAYTRLNPSELTRVVQEELAANKKLPIENTTPFVRWLAETGQNQQILDYLPAKRAENSAILLPFLINAMLGENKWQDLQSVLRTGGSSGRLPLSPTRVSLLKARCAYALAEPADIVKGHLEDANRTAQGTRDVASLSAVASACEVLGYNELAFDALSAMAEQPLQRQVVLERTLSLHERMSDTEGMLRTAKLLANLNSSSEEYTKSLLYLKLLTGEEMEVAALDSEKLQAKTGSSQAFGQLMKALYQFRLGNAAALKSGLADMDIATLTRGQRAVLAGMLASCGETSRAFVIGEKITPSTLLSEERKFLELSLR